MSCGFTPESLKVCVKEVTVPWEEGFRIDWRALLYAIDDFVALWNCQAVLSPIMYQSVAVDP
jgi:hypothetical protein